MLYLANWDIHWDNEILLFICINQCIFSIHWANYIQNNNCRTTILTLKAGVHILQGTKHAILIVLWLEIYILKWHLFCLPKTKCYTEICLCLFFSLNLADDFCQWNPDERQELFIYTEYKSIEPGYRTFGNLSKIYYLCHQNIYTEYKSIEPGYRTFEHLSKIYYLSHQNICYVNKFFDNIPWNILCGCLVLEE